MSGPTLVELGILSLPPTSGAQPWPSLNGPHFGGDPRLINAVYRSGSIWAAHTVASAGRYACRWYQIATRPPALIQTGIVEDSSVQYSLPGISANAHGDMIIGFSGSDATLYPGAYVTGRKASDGPGKPTGDALEGRRR
jgi:hypothetical protein